MKAVTNSFWKGHGFFTLLLCSRWRGRVGEPYSCIRTFWRWSVLLFVYSLLWKIGFCVLSIWALLDFRIQFNELLNSVTDKNENKNPYTEVNTCTINDFLFTVLTWILNTMKPHVFKICGTGAKKKKKKKKSFVSPYPTDPLKMTLTQNIFHWNQCIFLLPKFVCRVITGSLMRLY